MSAPLNYPGDHGFGPSRNSLERFSAALDELWPFQTSGEGPFIGEDTDSCFRYNLSRFVRCLENAGQT